MINKRYSNNIEQNINGNNNQMAANNIINEDNSFKPDASNPNLTTCYCGWEGLHINAEVCPQCGYNYLAEHQEQQAIAIQERKSYLATLFIIAILTVMAATQISYRTNYSFIESLGISLIIIAALGYGSVWIYTNISEWLNRRKIK